MVMRERKMPFCATATGGCAARETLNDMLADVSRAAYNYFSNSMKPLMISITSATISEGAFSINS